MPRTRLLSCRVLPCTWAVLVVVTRGLTALGSPAADPPTGEQIYRQNCSRCHGLTGDGTKKAPQPLLGDKSAAELAKVIEKTMPEDNPGSCSAADARTVAAYIFDAF